MEKSLTQESCSKKEQKNQNITQNKEVNKIRRRITFTEINKLSKEVRKYIDGKINPVLASDACAFILNRDIFNKEKKNNQINKK